jgi:hypothetical protein
LWSKHVDLKKSGDRLAECRAGMKPIGLTFKKEGRDKYGKIKQGELMLVHECQGCGRISVNRIAGDDDPKAVLGVLAESQKLNKDKKESLTASGIVLVAKEEEEKVMVQLFGKK